MADQRIHSDPDFVIAPKYNNSLKKLLKNYPDGCSIAVICKALQISTDEYEKLLASALEKLRSVMDK